MIKNILKIIIGTVLGLCIIFYTLPQILLHLPLPSTITTIAGKRAFLTTHNKPLAEKLLEKAVLDNPENQEAWYYLGRVYFVNNKLLQSETAFKKSITLDPMHEQSYYGLGLTYGYMSPVYLDDAAANFRKTLEVIEEKVSQGTYKTYPSGHWAAYNDLAWIYFQKKDFKKTEEVVRQALEKYNNPWLRIMLGTSLLNQNKPKEALDEYLLAKEYIKNMTYKDFGEAYTGDSSEWHKRGFQDMLKTIDDNIKIAQQEIENFPQTK